MFPADPGSRVNGEQRGQLSKPIRGVKAAAMDWGVRVPANKMRVGPPGGTVKAWLNREVAGIPAPSYPEPMVDYTVIEATRTTNTETRRGWAVERRDGRRAYVASALFETREQAEAEAERLSLQFGKSGTSKRTDFRR